jgi:lactate dehydrogenase-like 2-hydroxyacid dehydrogenase
MLDDALEMNAYPGPGRPGREWLMLALQEVGGILTSNQVRIDNDMIDRCPSLQVISNFGVGYDNVDIPYATAKGVLVCNTPGVLSDAVADLTMAFIVNLARGIIAADYFVRSGEWGRSQVPPLGMDLQGATLGVLGFGRVGHVVARRADAFGMRVLYYDPIRDRVAEDDHLAAYVERDELFRESDFVSAHLFLDEGTRRGVGSREFELMKSTAYFINTSRGLVVDQQALVDALRMGVIAGAALDVFEEEPPRADDPILSAPNLIATPHMASAAVNTRIAMAELAARNLIDALRGDTPEAMVNPEIRRRTE